MIVFDLRCETGHVFEAWFAGSDAFADQQRRGLVNCPVCGSAEVEKAVMAPRLAVGGAKDGQSELGLPAKMAAELMAWQRRALDRSGWVGDNFVSEARAMHYGERSAQPIHGRATLGDAKALVEEGVPVAPLPFPVAAPDEVN